MIDASTVRIGGVEPETLARAYGTPLLAIDTDVLDANVALFAALGAELEMDVAYAGKAFLIVAMARRLAATPLYLDVCSFGELLTAERACFPAERIVFHGCGKTDEELDAAIAGRAGRLVVDGREELARLCARPRGARPLSVLLRVNTGIEADTHAYVRTGGEDSKFGIALGEFDEAVAETLACPGLRLDGLHAHCGSQIFEAAAFEENLSVALACYARAHRRGAPLGQLIAGGGFGVDPVPGAPALDLGGILRALAARLRLESARLPFRAPRLGIEPGRAIVAAAGCSIYRVVSVKRQGARRFAIVDGSLADNPRPALYDAYHHPTALTAGGALPAEETTVCGRSCENDELVVAPLPADLASGDLLLMATTGAYTYSMAGNYNRFPRPAVVFAGGGAHREVVRRETPLDVLRCDVEDP